MGVGLYRFLRPTGHLEFMTSSTIKFVLNLVGLVYIMAILSDILV
jgi:hypothetical protein